MYGTCMKYFLCSPNIELYKKKRVFLVIFGLCTFTLSIYAKTDSANVFYGKKCVKNMYGTCMRYFLYSPNGELYMKERVFLVIFSLCTFTLTISTYAKTIIAPMNYTEKNTSKTCIIFIRNIFCLVRIQNSTGKSCPVRLLIERRKN